MALDDRFRSYLERFGRTTGVRELVARADEPDLTALRHDVDYDIDVALEAAFWEHRLERRASYYVLPTAAYWSDPRLGDKCLQLADYGHEVGLHVNVLAQWYRGEIDDVATALARQLETMRGWGLDIRSVAAHGDALCYEAGFTNYWLFRELRPERPEVSEHGVTAEGTRAGSSDRAIVYPASGRIVRPDGASFELWSLSLTGLGLDCEASRVPGLDAYFSDSGGTWKRSVDPAGASFERGRNLVLMHPIYWRAPQRHYYFLSTARSGSTWLARFLDRATSLTARHEFTLNHRIIDGMPVAEKRTGAGLVDLIADPEAVRALVDEARSWSETLRTDYAEANVYLERVLDALPQEPGTVLVHLRRDPTEVVRSLIERGWYNVPFDDRHPAVAVEGWNELSQLEQACWYVRDVDERLSAATPHRLDFHRMVTSLSYLTDTLVGLGIAVHPRLAREAFAGRLNQTESWSTPPVSAWPAEDRRTFRRILGASGVDRLHTRLAARLGGMLQRLALAAAPGRATPDAAAPVLLAGLDRFDQAGIVTTSRAEIRREGGAIALAFPDAIAGHVMLGGGRWHGGKGQVRGWEAGPGRLCTLGLTADFPEGAGTLRVLCLSYDAAGALIGQRDIGTLSRAWPQLARHFRPDRRARRFDIALYKGRGEPAFTARLRELALVWGAEARDLRLVPEAVLRQALADAAGVSARASRSKPILSLPVELGDLTWTRSPQTSSAGPITPWYVTCERTERGLAVSPAAADRPAHLLLAGGRWHRALIAPRGPGGAGPVCRWTVSPGDRLRGRIEASRIEEAGAIGVFLLGYADDGALIDQRSLGKLTHRHPALPFDAAISADARICNLALHFPVGAGAIELGRVEIAIVSSAKAGRVA